MSHHITINEKKYFKILSHQPISYPSCRRLRWCQHTPQVRRWRSWLQENVIESVGKIYRQKTTFSALYLMTFFPDTVSAPLTVNNSIILILSSSFLPSLYIVCLSRSFFSFISVSVSVQVHHAALIVFSSHSLGMCRHGLIIQADRCDL